MLTPQLSGQLKATQNIGGLHQRQIGSDQAASAHDLFGPGALSRMPSKCKQWSTSVLERLELPPRPSWYTIEPRHERAGRGDGVQAQRQRRAAPVGCARDDP